MPRRRKSVRPRTQSFRASTIERLSTPKAAHPANISNRPSVYCLDYIESNEALRLRTPIDLNNYYSRFYAKHPRLENLCRPKTCMCDSSEGSLRTPSGVPVSALNYCASPRIKELAQPRHYEPTGATGRTPPSGDRNRNNNADRNSTQVKSSAAPTKEKHNYEGNNFPHNSNGYKREPPSSEMHGGDAQPGRPPLQLQYTRRVPTSRNPPLRPQQHQSQSHSNILANKKRTKPTGSDSGLKKRGIARNNRTKLPPLVPAKKDEAGQQRKQSRRHHSNTKLPSLDLGNFY